MRKKLEPAAAAPERRSARERLLEAANELFYENGIHTVGIDRVIERAGVAKASLYDTFGSKEALVSAYLEARHAANRARIEAWIAPLATPREQLLGVFDAMAVAMGKPGFRGCAFARAGAESTPSGAVRGVCDTARGWMRELFARLASEAGVADAQSLATQLAMLYDGASVMGQMERNPAPAQAAKQAAAALLDAAPKAAKTRAKRS